VVAALVEMNDTVVLVRNASWPDGMFGLVTGYLEQGEEPAAGAAREVHEELGLCAEVVGIIGSYAFPMKNELIVAYHLRAAGQITPNEEIAEYKQVPIAKLRPWPVATGLAVRDWLAARNAKQ
jgi:NAD+ diphosphatase